MMEKWEDKRDFSFPNLRLVKIWDGKVKECKTFLFGWEEKWKDEKK